MDSARRRTIDHLYLSAAALKPAERAAFLEEACAGDESLRAEVESLLRYQGAAEEFLEVPALDGQAAALAHEWERDECASLTGHTLGRYQILEKIGAGGMGMVYRARDLQLDRVLAIKVLPPGMAADEDRKARFVREAKAASALNHPNIITIYDIGSAEGADFIAMEYVEGRTLREIIASGELNTRDALEYAVQMVSALASAHSAGIIHRDIKPANIMVASLPSGSRQVKVLDFGVAKLLESPQRGDTLLTATTTRGMVVGTAAYMSPEQAEGKAVDARSDIFSFGAVLYEMLSGRRAFAGTSNAAILAAVLREDPEPATAASPLLQSILCRCLRKSPSLRFQRAGDLKQALEASLFQSPAPGIPLKSIAVLPFANFSPDKDNEYFSEGLTEEIINALTKLPGLQVTARTSAFALRNQDMDVREIGAKLNVEHILEGSVRRIGNRVRVTAQLVGVDNGYHLWSERYDREMTDWFAIQDEITQAVVETLRVRLSRDNASSRGAIADPEAYTLYLKGRHYQEKRSPEGYARAKEYFERALEVAPSYAPAYLGIAEFYWQNALYGFQYPRGALAKAKEANLRALALDESLAEGHANLGALFGIADFDWKAAELSFQRALELSPNSPYVLFRYANYYLWPWQRNEEAIATIERILALDPLSVVSHWVLGYYVYALRQYERAIKHLFAVSELEPSFYFTNCVIGLVHLRSGRSDEAIRALEHACEVCAGSPFALGMLAYGYGYAGKREESRKLIGELEDMGKHSYVPAKSLLFAWAGLGDWDRALAYAGKAVDEERDPMAVMNIANEPLFDPVRSDPRYHALLRTAHLQIPFGNP